jgi:hypothetical protein
VNGDSKRTNERGPSWLVRRACRVGTRDFCSALAALFGPIENIFFRTVHYFNSFVHIAQQAGQADVLGRLSLSVCLWPHLPQMQRTPLMRLSPFSTERVYYFISYYSLYSLLFSFFVFY